MCEWRLHASLILTAAAVLVSNIVQAEITVDGSLGHTPGSSITLK